MREGLLDLADRVLGPGLREHSWPWLRDDAGERLVVDAFWPDHAVAVVILDREPTAHWMIAYPTMHIRGIGLVGLDAAAFGDDEAADLERLEGLRTLEGRWDNQALEGSTVIFGGSIVSDSDSYDLEEDEDVDDSWQFDPIEPEFPVLELGWRSRPIALAILGAATLARRAFSRQTLGSSIEPDAMQLLVAYAVADHEAPSDESDVQAMAHRLAMHPSDAQHAMRSLEAAGLLDAPDAGQELPPRVTPAGLEAITAWLRRVGPLFSGAPAVPVGR